MKKLIYLIICLGILALGSTSIADSNMNAKKRCMVKWATDYEMVEYCYTNQVEANIKFFEKYYKRYVTPYVKNGKFRVADLPEEGKICVMCLEKWKDEKFNTCDWEMVHYCTERNINAYHRIK